MLPCAPTSALDRRNRPSGRFASCAVPEAVPALSEFPRHSTPASYRPRERFSAVPSKPSQSDQDVPCVPATALRRCCTALCPLAGGGGRAWACGFAHSSRSVAYVLRYCAGFEGGCSADLIGYFKRMLVTPFVVQQASLSPAAKV